MAGPSSITKMSLCTLVDGTGEAAVDTNGCPGPRFSRGETGIMYQADCSRKELMGQVWGCCLPDGVS